MSSLVRHVVVAFSIRNRIKKAELIRAFIAETRTQTVILVGVAGSSSQRNESIVEHAIPLGVRVVSALDVIPAQTEWPFVVGDGRALPYRGDAADLIVSNAVIEHVGDDVDQRQFVAEHTRVARAWVISTPNRWFPVESHTSVLFRHWSVEWRTKRVEFTRLLSLSEFRALLPEGTRIVGRPWSPTFVGFFERNFSSQIGVAETDSKKV